MTRRAWGFVILALLGPLASTAAAQRLPSRLGSGSIAPPKTAATRPTPDKSGPATPAAARPTGPEKPVPFRAGETLTYDVSWSDYLTAGTATLTVRDKRASFGSTAYYVVAEGRPTPLVSKLYSVYYKADSLVDAYTLFPQRGSLFSQEGSRQRMKETRFDQGRGAATFQMRTSTTMTQEQSLPGPTHDGLSALTVMRTMTFTPGSRLSFPVSDSGYLYQVTAAVTARETVQTATGAVAAWKVVPSVRDAKGQSVGRGLAVWFSDDARRVPVRIEAQLPVGAFVLTLREAR